MPAWPALAWLVFLVYGSLVPLDYHPRPWAEALSAFSQIPWLSLGVASRADWVANILLYLPMGYFAAAWLAGDGRNASARIAAVLMAVPLCLVLALCVEFIQLYFPPRTVSLNDLLAETLGTLAGALVYLAAGRLIQRLLERLLGGGAHALRTLFFAYLAAYLFLNLFPFDFLLNSTELSVKWSGDTVAWFLAGSGCEDAALCLFKLVVEALLVAPLGAFLAHRGAVGRNRWMLAALLGLVLGFILESLQLMVASSVVQGASVLTRAIGMTIGYAVYRHFAKTGARPAPGWAMILAAVVWLLLLVWLNRWFTQDWLPWDQALARLDMVRFMPFYYHYYTTETAALVSLLSVAGMYAPAGALLWLSERTRPQAASLAAMSAAVLCSAMEIGRLFLPDTHPDPSNVFIAALAAAGTVRLLELARRWSLQHLLMADVPAPPKLPARRHSRAAQFLAILMLAGLVLALLAYPLNVAILATGLMAYAWALWRRPTLWLFWIPALLPALNLNPLSGNLLFDELDAVLLVTVVILYLRMPGPDRAANSWAPFALLGGSTLISMAVGMWPLPTLDANAFSSYFSAYNALRLGKGILWALLLGFWLHRSRLRMEHTVIRFARGMTWGLLFTAGWVVWERAVYPGLFNFQADFRVTGPFVEMHTGGGAIESYLVAALPFAFLTWRRSASLAGRWPAGLAMLLGGYALGVTYARAGYLGLSVMVAVLLFGLGWRALKHLWRGRSPLVLTMLVILAAAIATLPLWLGDYMPKRFAQVDRDAGIRAVHWRDSLAMLDSGDWIAGAGLGSYPRTYLWRNGEGKFPAHYRFMQDHGNNWVHLTTGLPLYFEQIIEMRPGRTYRLSLDARASPGVKLSVLICEKAMLYSTRCVDLPVPAETLWRPRVIELNSGEVGEGAWYERRVVKLALHASGQDGYADVDNLHLLDLAGSDLVRNGDFSAGMAYWSFATDNHLPWHVKNLGLHILFEQGVLGVITWITVLLLAVTRLTRQARRGDMPALALLAALLGMLVIGLFDSVLDVPRLTLLLLLMCMFALSRGAPSGRLH
jgi:VanZ family protein